MKVYNHLYHNKQKFDIFLNGTGIDRSKQALIRIHSSVHTAEEMSNLAGEISKLLPNARIIGCSTPGVILDGKIISDACLVSITLFDKCEVESLFIDKSKNDKQLCADISEKLIKGRSGFLLVFLPAGFTRGIMLADLITKKAPGVKILGGAAGYKAKKSRSYVLEGSNTSEKAVSAAFISSDSLFVYENFVCGADSSGKSCTVTKSRKCCLEKIDGVSGAKWYSEFLDKTELENDPELSVLFPIIWEDGIQIPYFVKYEHKKEERLELSCELPSGSAIYSGYFNPQKTLGEMRTVYQELKQAPSELLYAYDCQSRMIVMHSCAKWEAEQFTATNISGALLSGELVWRDGRNYFANFTFAAASLSENENAHIPLRSRDFSDSSAIRQNNVKAVNYLLASGNRQLNEQLENQQNKIKNSLLRNEALGLDNQFCYLCERENIHLNKIALYVLNNEKMVKLFVGRREIFEELKKVYGNVTEKLNEMGIVHIYSYETSSLLIAAEDNIGTDRFEKIAEDTLKYLNSISLNDVQLSYQCAVVEDKNEPLHKAETALQYGSEHNIPFVKYGRIADSIMDKTEKIHILQVIRDALSEERVVPYFQGIYDNAEKCFGLYESLMRIADKSGKIYFPDQFLPVAKKYNLYELLSVVMVKKVMKMFIDSDIKVTINLNVRDIYDREMIKVIFRYLNKAAHPENFIFELVESEEVTDYQYIKEFADRIHEKNAKIAIDDFGSGFSNLMHIIRIDADFLKIDGEIIRSICDDEKCMQFVGIITSWCSNQKKQVIAEFVENEKIQSIIEEMGIRYSQGYYFSKPGPWETAAVQ
ncbi:EAL domain-containing protein [Huintestinicola sp.]|uniref:bifunctional diguanylate cyclase/phosphodiesterase n=1 Tax=Huintestinicola sp. TaxID=2981661 RepID=UPI003D7D219E